MAFPFRVSANDRHIIDAEVHKLLTLEVIEKCLHCRGEYISNIFLRQKPNNTYRVILDLKDLNESVQYHHFKMDTFKTALNLVTPNCWFGSVDLKHAYYSCLIRPADRKYLRFVWNRQLYQFRVLPNGLSEAPRKFTKLLKVVFSALRKKGHTNVGFIDDSLLQRDDRSECQDNIVDSVRLMDKLGFTDHPGKSVLMPCQVMEFLGFIIDSVSMTVRLSDRKCDKIKSACADILQRAK